MRARLLRPEITTDEVLGGLPDALVLFYLKLWLLTDDDGYFEWRPRQIAATLYPYRADRYRVRQVVEWLATLVTIERVKVLECGDHGVVPTIPKHRIQGGKLTSQHHKKHADTCRYMKVRTDTQRSSSESVSESVSINARASAMDDEERAARFAAFRRQGLPVDVAS